MEGENRKARKNQPRIRFTKSEEESGAKQQ
jgi:hypothetical protein